MIWAAFGLFATVVVGGLFGILWWTTDGFSSSWDEL